MKVIICRPLEMAEVVEIENNLETLQQIVEGYIECVYPFEDEVCIICNDEGKMNGSLPNRALCDDEGRIYDVVFGTMIICGLGEENFESLTDEQIETYMEQFEYAQIVI